MSVAPNIFLTYRRSDSEWGTRIHAELDAHFGSGVVYFDEADIAPGQDIASAAIEAIRASSIVLVVIGPKWAAETDDDGERRIDNPDDLIRIEVGTALASDKIVIPVLVDDAPFPDPSALPQELVLIIERQSIQISPEKPEADIDRLIAAIEELIETQSTTPFDVSRLSDSTRRAFSIARQVQETTEHDAVGLEHLLYGLAQKEDGPAWTVFRDLGLIEDRLLDVLGLPTQPPYIWSEIAGVTDIPPMSDEAIEALSGAESSVGSERLVQSRDLFLAALEVDRCKAVERLNNEFGLTSEKARLIIGDLPERTGGDALEKEQKESTPTPTEVVTEPDPTVDREPAISIVTEVSRDYWTVRDTLNLTPYVEALVAFIQDSRTRPPLTVGLKAAWGAGKTSLMRMVQKRLDPPCDEESPRWEFPGIRVSDDGEKKSRPKMWDAVRRSSRAASPELQVVGPRANGCPDTDGGGTPEEIDDERWRPTVWFNPWMYQSREEVWAGLAHSIIEQVTERLDPVDRERFWFRLNLARVDGHALRRRLYRLGFESALPWLVAVVAAGALFLTQSLTTFDWQWWWTALGAAGAFTATTLARPAGSVMGTLVQSPTLASTQKMLSGALEGFTDEVFPDPGYGAKSGFLAMVQNDVRKVLDLVATRERPLVIFVDDLDRCSPSVVAETIEAMNLFLAGEFPNCIFVMALEPSVVAAHVEVANEKLVKKLAEDQLARHDGRLGWRFLEKIVHLSLTLPAPDKTAETKYLESLVRTPDGGGEQDEDGVKDPIESIADAAAEAARTEKVTMDRLPNFVEATIRDSALEESDFERAKARVAAKTFVEVARTDDEGFAEFIEREIEALGQTNPRQVKRIFNLFRFYSYIAVNRAAASETPEPVRDTLSASAHLAAFVIRWPELLDVVSRQTADGNSVLAELEHAAQDGMWDDQLLKLFGTSRPEYPWEDLEKFLGGNQPRIGALAQGLI